MCLSKGGGSHANWTERGGTGSPSHAVSSHLAWKEERFALCKLPWATRLSPSPLAQVGKLRPSLIVHLASSSRPRTPSCLASFHSHLFSACQTTSLTKERWQSELSGRKRPLPHGPLSKPSCRFLKRPREELCKTAEEAIPSPMVLLNY